MPLFYIFVVTIIIFIITALFCENKKRKFERKNGFQGKKESCIKETRTDILCIFIAWEKTAIVVGTF